MVKIWNTGLAAERARHNLKLKKKKAAGPKRQATSHKRHNMARFIWYKMLKKEKIKEMKLEIERLKKLPDYEYVILDIQKEIECLKKKRKK